MNIEKADEVELMCLQVSQVLFCILSFRFTICVTHFAIETSIYLHVHTHQYIELNSFEHKSFDAMHCGSFCRSHHLLICSITAITFICL